MCEKFRKLNGLGQARQLDSKVIHFTKLNPAGGLAQELAGTTQDKLL